MADPKWAQELVEAIYQKEEPLTALSIVLERFLAIDGRFKRHSNRHEDLKEKVSQRVEAETRRFAQEHADRREMSKQIEVLKKENARLSQRLEWAEDSIADLAGVLKGRRVAIRG